MVSKYEPMVNPYLVCVTFTYVNLIWRMATQGINVGIPGSILYLSQQDLLDIQMPLSVMGRQNSASYS